MSIISYVKSRRLKGLMIKELKTIGLIESIVAILTLQNTLISVNGGTGDDLYYLTVVTSFIGWTMIVSLLIFMLIEGLKNK
jgi:hypothetical protein